MRRLLEAFVLTVVLGLLLSTTAAAAPPALSTLEPGGFRTIDQDLDVNIVFVGYEEGEEQRDIDLAAFLAGLPEGYRAIARYPVFYGLQGDLGLTFTYDYNVVFADPAFEDDFFTYLSGIATAADLTEFQGLYNQESTRSLDVTENHFIDAPSVEQWLAVNPPSGVDTSDYTIYFVNWYGRSDFKYHVYTKTGEPDPDTGYDFGVQRQSRKVIAWGGTAPDDEETGWGGLHRIWFYDLSAGPESWTDNWNLSVADLDDNGVTDYRMPPVWEYGNLAAYRPFDDLSGDLAKVARYVGLDLLFTASPLYKPAISPPRLPQAIELDVNLYQGVPGTDGRDFVEPNLITTELGELQQLNSFTLELQEAAYTNRARDVYETWFADQYSSFGFRLFGIAFADLYLYHLDQLTRFIEGDGDYEVPIFAYNVADELTAGLLGYADDNWADGTQTFVFAFDSDYYRSLGYGFTTTLIHETGHHLGMSHPHDGFDSEADVDFAAADAFYFAWSGDESNSIMNYMDLNWDFSQFDRDNMNRYLTVTYINQANRVLGSFWRSKKLSTVGSLLTEADEAAGDALSAYAIMDYPAAAAHARSAYLQVLAAAEQLRVPVEPQAWIADYKALGVSRLFVDPIDGHRGRR